MTTKHQKTQDADPSLADTVGEGFAVVQHGIDKVIEWGFNKMKETDTDEPIVDISNPYLRKAADAGRKTLGFLGKAGAAYYRRYEELKRTKER